MDIRIVDSSIDHYRGKEAIILTEEHNGKKFSQKKVYIKGPDVWKLDFVTYYIDKKRKQYTVSRKPSNPKCRIKLWVNGDFEIEAIAHFKNGHKVFLEHKVLLRNAEDKDAITVKIDSNGREIVEKQSEKNTVNSYA